MNDMVIDIKVGATFCGTALRISGLHSTFNDVDKEYKEFQVDWIESAELSWLADRITIG